MYSFRFQPYCYSFRVPLQTNYGLWQVREGVIVQLQSNGVCYQGEIAPLPWFGSETLEQAIAFCHQLPPIVSEQLIASIPDDLPACQFGFESALQPAIAPPTRLAYSRLLPAGKDALECWQPLWRQGYRTFKWKIGVYPLAQELTLFHQLLHALPAEVHLRLDANGGLTSKAACTWLSACDSARVLATLEYLEQPLPPDQFATLQKLSSDYRTPIALDESVTTVQRLQQVMAQGWQSVMVIKPAIAGFPSRLRQLLQHHPADVVFSSVFETAIGRRAGLQLAAELGNPKRAVGYDGTWETFDYFVSEKNLSWIH